MIGLISGKVVFSDGEEAIIEVSGGLGYQVYCNYVLARNTKAILYLSHIVRETVDDFYGFRTLRDKKMFDMLMDVKGVGPKSAYALVTGMGASQISQAIVAEDKTLLRKIPGIGPKAAAQIILDLAKKIHRIKQYSDEMLQGLNGDGEKTVNGKNKGKGIQSDAREGEKDHQRNEILNEALSACQELGLEGEQIIGKAQKFLSDRSVTTSEQLVRNILREI